MKCSISHCEKNVQARGWCANHYRAWKVYGDPTGGVQKQHHGMSVRERFFIYTKKTDGCWPWLGGTDVNGYGKMSVDQKPQLASRVSYMLHFGDVPAGLGVLHKCDTPLCVNPDHLFLGTQADNVADMHTKGRANKRGLKGEEHHAAKVTPEIVRTIRASTDTERDLAKRFGISNTTVHDIRKRRSWAHVD